MLKKVIAVDREYADRVAYKHGLRHFPIAEFRNAVERGLPSDSERFDEVDVLEVLVSLVKRVAEADSPEAIAANEQNFRRISDALEMKGARVIACPATPQGGGFKQSDDQRLVVATLATCLDLRPDYLILVAGDGDFAPLVEELRLRGVRTEVVGDYASVASELRRKARAVIDLNEVLEQLKATGIVRPAFDPQPWEG